LRHTGPVDHTAVTAQDHTPINSNTERRLRWYATACQRRQQRTVRHDASASTIQGIDCLFKDADLMTGAAQHIGSHQAAQ